jgi:hypothetical protein
MPGSAPESRRGTRILRGGIEAQRHAVKSTAGRFLLCVKDHFATLSERCKNAIGHASERKLGAGK